MVEQQSTEWIWTQGGQEAKVRQEEIPGFQCSLQGPRWHHFPILGPYLFQLPTVPQWEDQVFTMWACGDILEPNNNQGGVPTLQISVWGKTASISGCLGLEEAPRRARSPGMTGNRVKARGDPWGQNQVSRVASVQILLINIFIFWLLFCLLLPLLPVKAFYFHIFCVTDSEFQ